MAPGDELIQLDAFKVLKNKNFYQCVVVHHRKTTTPDDTGGDDVPELPFPSSHQAGSAQGDQASGAVGSYLVHRQYAASLRCSNQDREISWCTD